MSKPAEIILWGLDGQVPWMAVSPGTLRTVSDKYHSTVAGPHTQEWPIYTAYSLCPPLFVAVFLHFKCTLTLVFQYLVLEKITIGKVTFTVTFPSGNKVVWFLFICCPFFFE